MDKKGNISCSGGGGMGKVAKFIRTSFIMKTDGNNASKLSRFSPESLAKYGHLTYI